MDLYFSPLACSLATRIALYEAGAEANYLEVDPKTKVVQKDGSDFRAVNPLGLVPTLRSSADAAEMPAPGCQVLCVDQEPVAARLSRKLPEGPRIPARSFQRRRCLSRHH